MIPDALLTSFRAQVAARLPDTCVIQARSDTGDGAGGPGTVAYTAVTGGTVACRIDPIKSNSQDVLQVGRGEHLRVQYQLTAPHDAPVEIDRRLVINGENYEVVSLSAEHSWRVSTRAIIGRID